VALTYEMFTASVILLQGRAESLLQAGPAQRHDLLAQIVGLDRYADLYQRAQRQAALAQGAAAKLRQQLHDTPQVTPRQLDQAQQAACQARRAHAEAAKQLAELEVPPAHAQQWEQLSARQTELQNRIRQLAQLQHDERKLQLAYRRWEVLNDHWDELVSLAQRQATAAHCRQQIEQLDRQQSQLRRQASTLEQSSAKTAAAIEHLQQRLQQATESHTRWLQRQASIGSGLELLERLHRATGRLRDSLNAAEKMDRQLRDVQRRAKQLSDQLPRGADVAQARARLHSAGQHLAEAAAEHGRLDQQLKRFHLASDDKICRWCRQPLPASHVATELASLQRESEQAGRIHRQAEQAAAAATAELAALESQQQAAQSELKSAERELGRLQGSIQAARHAAQECQQLCAELYDDLPAVHRQRIGTDRPRDWTTVCYPESADLRELKDAKQRSGSEARQRAEQMAQYRRELARQQARQKEESLERQALTVQIRQVAEDISRQLQMRQASDRDGRADDVTGTSLQWMQLFGAATPDELREEKQALQQADIAGRYRRLSQAQTEHQQLLVEQAVIEDRLAAVPPEARCDSATRQRRIDLLRQTCATEEQVLQENTAKALRLTEAASGRQAISQAYQQADRQLHLWTRLAELLGRDGLQRALVRHAEFAIVECANAILDRISAGQLHLLLAEDGANHRSGRKALNLLAHSLTSQGVVQDVAFLSGSQKFRVAVSLSLAIGQYASGARRAVQSVIIDEGFGCLDTVNRQVMIQELQNLRNQLERIILVSHQDEFASAFADGYCCQIIDGATRLEPFHR
jgi:DNA repair exonuclease SbcCD ATPase subunit